MSLRLQRIIFSMGVDASIFRVRLRKMVEDRSIKLCTETTSANAREGVGLDEYRLFRSRIVEEDNLINHRMNWLLWTSAILMSFWGATVIATLRDHDISGEIVRIYLFCAGVIIALAGEALAISSRISISAARAEVERIRDEYYNYIRNRDISIVLLRSVTGEMRPHLSGHLSAKFIPWIFISIWFPLILISIYSLWVKV